MDLPELQTYLEKELSKAKKEYAESIGDYDLFGWYSENEIQMYAEMEAANAKIDLLRDILKLFD